MVAEVGKLCVLSWHLKDFQSSLSFFSLTEFSNKTLTSSALCSFVAVIYSILGLTSTEASGTRSFVPSWYFIYLRSSLEIFSVPGLLDKISVSLPRLSSSHLPFSSFTLRFSILLFGITGLRKIFSSVILSIDCPWSNSDSDFGELQNMKELVNGPFVMPLLTVTFSFSGKSQPTSMESKTGSMPS